MNMQIRCSEDRVATQLSGTKLEIRTIISFVNKYYNAFRLRMITYSKQTLHYILHNYITGWPPKIGTIFARLNFTKY